MSNIGNAKVTKNRGQNKINSFLFYAEMKNSNFYRLLEQEVRHFNGKVTKINERNTKENTFFYFHVKGLELIRFAPLSPYISLYLLISPSISFL